MAPRYRATFLLQLLILVALAASSLTLLSLLDGAPLMLALIVLAALYVAVELEVLPKLVEWWVLRWAARHAPKGSIFFVDVEAGKARREDDRRDVEENPTLW
jgi:membrane protein YdbS with pleckstrin-like domain